MTKINQLLLIGCGNMGGAMLAGWLKAGIDPSRFAVLDPMIESVPDGVTLHREPPADSQHDAVLLGIKPQQLPQLGPTFQPITGEGVTVYSLLAGITLESLKDAFPDAAAHVRVMPNLASRICKSPIILAETGLDAEARDAAFSFFDVLGTAIWLEDEEKFDLVTALAGSGPGFVFRFIDALGRAGAQLGLPKEQSDALALQMVEGSALLAGEADISPGELADRVASPGGMTREGLNVLDSDDAILKLLVETLKATAEKGSDLAAELGKNG